VKAGEWKCPECGAGFRDVAPAYEIGPAWTFEGRPLPGESSGAITGHCMKGHHYFAGWNTGDDGKVCHWSEAVEPLP
jgi:hypothetical protein